MEWIKTTDKLPNREPNVDYSQVPCIVWDTRYSCVRILNFNHEQECWDDEFGDDYECDIERVSHWMPIPDSPES
jgi:hypothetical protein